jgi:hypothetical protein
LMAFTLPRERVTVAISPPRGCCTEDIHKFLN